MNLLNKSFSHVLAVGLVMLCSNALAQELTDVNEIVTKANQVAYYPGTDARAQARMRIVDAQGRKQSRQFTILRKNKPDSLDQDMLVFFERPTDVAGTVFRVAKHARADVEDDRWLYLPGLDLVKRISAGDNRTSFVGAHFFYEDVSGRHLAEDNFQLLSAEQNRYLVKGTPKNTDSVEFAYYQAFLDKKTLLPVTVTYFDQNEQAIRKLEVLKTQVFDGITTVVHSKLSDLRSGGYTEMQFRNVQYNIGLPDSIFSERSLRNPPKQWLR
jgi:hypothetical protein